MRRVMLIVWKWRDFENKIVRDDLLKNHQYENVIEDIGSVNEKLFDEYRIFHGNSTPLKPVNPEAKIVRTRVEHGPEQRETLKFIAKLITFYKPKPDNPSLFVFLHRDNGFSDQHVTELLSNTQADKCFLFGEGRDYIYHNTQNQGLLGDDQHFFQQKSNMRQPRIMVADDSRKIVFLPHFDKVWNYYAHEFFIKIYELKENLLSHFFLSLKENPTWTSKQYYEHLKKDKWLFLRVKSFINDECDCLNTEEEKELKSYEIEEQKSFVFDDCRANLEKVAKIKKEYDDIEIYLKDLIFNKGNTDKQRELSASLQGLNHRFELLLDAITENPDTL